MNKLATRWFNSYTQQAVMSRVGSFNVIAHTGPTANGGKSSRLEKETENVFIVGESEIGGKDRIKGQR